MRDLRWFSRFLETKNGVSIYNHRPVNCTIELDACLTGLGGMEKFCVSSTNPQVLPESHNCPSGDGQNLICHYDFCCSLVKIMIKWDNHAFVQVLTNNNMKTPSWQYHTVLHDIEVSHVHIMGKCNMEADTLSRWSNSEADNKFFSPRCRTHSGWLFP